MRKSFTLIEVVFAVGIILIFLGALIAIFNIGSRNAIVSAHRLQAANLARGAAEIAKEVRDTGKVTPGWAGMNVDCWLPGSAAGIINHPRPDCGTVGNLRLGFSAKPDSATYDLVTFTRQVTITNVTSDIKKITATVSWSDYGKNYSVIVVTYLTNY